MISLPDVKLGGIPCLPPMEKLKGLLEGMGPWRPGKSVEDVIWEGGPGLGSLKLVKTAWGPAPLELFPVNYT